MIPPPPYTKEMYTEFLRYAYEHDTEFVTLLDLAERIKAFEKARFNYSFDSFSHTITADGHGQSDRHLRPRS